VVFCDRVESLRSFVSAPDISVVVAEPHDVNGVGVSAALAEMATDAVAREIILLFDLTQRAVQLLLELLESDVPARLALRTEDGWGPIESARRDLTRQRAHRTLVRRTVPFVVTPLRPFFAACALLAGTRERVSHLARLAGLAPRTLEARLAKAGYPRARSIASWYRVLHVAWHLDVEGLAIKQLVGVGEEGLHARRALGNLVRRHTGLTLASLGTPGAFPALLYRFLAQLGVAIAKD
jgi:hypothetical protein